MATTALHSLSTLMAHQGAEMLERVKRSLVQVRDEPRGAGSGIIWRGDGIIITNHHVVAGSEESRRRISVLLSTGASYPARVLKTHPEIDLAILKVEASELPVAMIADSRGLRVGQLVFAFGHPWGLPWVVTAGVVSALVKARTQQDMEVPIIRSDSLLAPGNSGGPLVNAAGGVVGINTMIVGGDQSVAIPSHLAQAFVEEAT